jgi:hypothetical protein
LYVSIIVPTASGFLLQFLDSFRRFGFSQIFVNSSFASSLKVVKYERCAPVIGSSPVVQLSGL